MAAKRARESNHATAVPTSFYTVEEVMRAAITHARKHPGQRWQQIKEECLPALRWEDPHKYPPDGHVFVGISHTLLNGPELNSFEVLTAQTFELFKDAYIGTGRELDLGQDSQGTHQLLAWGDISSTTVIFGQDAPVEFSMHVAVHGIKEPSFNGDTDNLFSGGLVVRSLRVLEEESSSV
jgi:hypothetical protein